MIHGFVVHGLVICGWRFSTNSVSKSNFQESVFGSVSEELDELQIMCFLERRITVRNCEALQGERMLLLCALVWEITLWVGEPNHLTRLRYSNNSFKHH